MRERRGYGQDGEDGQDGRDSCWQNTSQHLHHLTLSPQETSAGDKPPPYECSSVTFSGFLCASVPQAKRVVNPPRLETMTCDEQGGECVRWRGLLWFRRLCCRWSR